MKMKSHGSFRAYMIFIIHIILILYDFLKVETERSILDNKALKRKKFVTSESIRNYELMNKCHQGILCKKRSHGSMAYSISDALTSCKIFIKLNWVYSLDCIAKWRGIIWNIWNLNIEKGKDVSPRISLMPYAAEDPEAALLTT